MPGGSKTRTKKKNETNKQTIDGVGGLSCVVYGGVSGQRLTLCRPPVPQETHRGELERLEAVMADLRQTMSAAQQQQQESAMTTAEQKAKMHRELELKEAQVSPGPGGVVGGCSWELK